AEADGRTAAVVAPAEPVTMPSITAPSPPASWSPEGDVGALPEQAIANIRAAHDATRRTGIVLDEWTRVRMPVAGGKSCATAGRAPVPAPPPPQRNDGSARVPLCALVDRNVPCGAYRNGVSRAVTISAPAQIRSRLIQAARSSRRPAHAY